MYNNDMNANTEPLKSVKDDVAACKKCSLFETRTLPVIGVGSHNAEIMFVGEAPGANEDRTGVPFCGKAGAILDEMLAVAGVRREDVYICNILKCRPPGNRNPEMFEIEACTVFLDRQIEIMKPKILCCLGNFAASYLMQKFGLGDLVRGISKMHGQIYTARADWGDILLVPFYHPAVATYQAQMKNILKEDFLAIYKRLQELK